MGGNMETCKHEKMIPVPDSLAAVCEACGLVFVDGERWNYKSGHIGEWVKDYGEALIKRDSGK